MEIITMIIGALITGLVSWFFYARAAKQLKEETKEVRRLTTMVLQAMEIAGLVKLSRDAYGNITGIVVNISGHATGTASVSGELTLTSKT